MGSSRGASGVERNSRMGSSRGASGVERNSRMGSSRGASGVERNSRMGSSRGAPGSPRPRLIVELEEVFEIVLRQLLRTTDVLGENGAHELALLLGELENLLFDGPLR